MPELIIISLPADLDLSDIYNHTVRVWDAQQAENYLQFLREQFRAIEDDPSLGYALTNRSGILCFIAKPSKRRSSHGHRIFYRLLDFGIEIVRVIHTSMDWQQYL